MFHRRAKYRYRVSLSQKNRDIVYRARDKHLRVYMLNVDMYAHEIHIHMADGNQFTVPFHWFEQEAEPKELDFFAISIKSGGLAIRFAPDIDVPVQAILQRYYEP